MANKGDNNIRLTVRIYGYMFKPPAFYEEGG